MLLYTDSIDSFHKFDSFGNPCAAPITPYPSDITLTSATRTTQHDSIQKRFMYSSQLSVPRTAYPGPRSSTANKI